MLLKARRGKIAGMLQWALLAQDTALGLGGADQECRDTDPSARDCLLGICVLTLFQSLKE